MMTLLLLWVVEAARQRKRDATVAETSTQDSSLLDDIQLDDDDTVEMVEMTGGVTAGVRGRGALDSEDWTGVRGQRAVESEDLEEVDTSMSLQGLVGVHEAILMSIDKCGQLTNYNYN